MAAKLEVLAEKRDDLLLAEIAAWLHDMGKCSDEMIEIQAIDKTITKTFDYKKDFLYLLDPVDREITICTERVTIKELLEKGKPGNIKNTNSPWIVRCLGRCHAAAHIEKEGQAKTKQSKNNTRLSNVFGLEGEPLIGLTSKLENLPFFKLDCIQDNRKIFLDFLKETFKNAPGDTEIPINEVNLWDWSSIVASLYKASLASALLGVKPEPNDLKWQLLAVRFDAAQIWNTATKITILQARKNWLQDGLDNLKKMLEVEYPLGNEIYRDDNGSIFVVPDIPDLLQIKDTKKTKTLKELIMDVLGYDGEINVKPAMDFKSWWGQNPSGRYDSNKDETPPIAELLEIKPYSPPDEKQVKSWWTEITKNCRELNKNNPEICNVSYLRPQGPGKGFQRKMSDFWAEKVIGRARDWFKDQCKTTIWIDEIADSNGRVCLIAGEFEIMEWLKPKGYLTSLFVKPPDVSKTPSFARLRRIWETCKTFWDEVENDFEETVGRVERRLKIQAKFNPGKVKELAPFYAYIAWDERNNVQFSIITNDQDSYYITENLQWLAKKMGADLDDEQSPVQYVKEHLSSKLKVYDSEGETREQLLGTLDFDKTNIIIDNTTSYLPVVSLLSEPGRFMALVPAAKALKVAHRIKEKYIKEMGKVRNRLPLALGLVFTPSHTPLVALLDAGKRMLDMPLPEKNWIVNESKDDGDDHLLRFENGLEWRVPVKMGESKIMDIWYPYFYLNTETTGEPLERTRAFKGSQDWLVHVTALKKGDIARIRPSYFDFEFLDSSARRFEISYTGEGKRRSVEKSTKPYYLEELDHFESLWELLSRLSLSQIMNINVLIETKREEWRVEAGDEKNDEVFREFVCAVFQNARWERKVSPEEMAELIDAACSGNLNDVIKLHHQILKQKPDKKAKEVAL
jgi:hypothetical protein